MVGDVKYVNDSLGVSSVLGLTTSSVVMGVGDDTVEVQRGNVTMTGELTAGGRLDVGSGVFTAGDFGIKGGSGSFEFSFLNGEMSAKMFEDNLSYSGGTVSIADRFHFTGGVLDATEAGVVVNFARGVFNGLVVQPSSRNKGDGSLTVGGESSFGGNVRVNASHEVNVDDSGTQSFGVNCVSGSGAQKESVPVFSVTRDGVSVLVDGMGEPTFSVSSGVCALGPNRVEMESRAALGDVLCCVNGNGVFKPLNLSDLSVLAKFPCALVRCLVPVSSDRYTDGMVYMFNGTSTDAWFNGYFIAARVWLSVATDGGAYGTETFQDVTNQCVIKVVASKAQNTFRVQVFNAPVGVKYLTLVSMSV